MENHSNINNQFIPYELALELKELGFKDGVLAQYRVDGYLCWGKDDCSLGSDISDEDYKNNCFTEFGCRAALWQQAFLYLWNKTGRYIIPIPNNDKEWLCMGNKFKTYEEARLECLKKLIEIVKNESK